MEAEKKAAAIETVLDNEKCIKGDELIKSQILPFFVIPAKAGIQQIRLVIMELDSGFHQSDDFLRSR
jgi:hypothetical protein